MHMNNILGVVLIFTMSHYGFSWKLYSEENLPQMFGVDDYYKCEKQHGTYCKVELHITGSIPNSIIAREIRKSQKKAYRFNRSFLYRLMCIPKNEVATDYIQLVSEQKLKMYNVTFEISDLTCDGNKKTNSLDYMVFLIILLYIWLIYTATKYDVNRRRNPEYPLSKYDKWLQLFSIPKSWNSTIAKTQNEDFEKLKCIQGIRFYNIVLVITCHSKMVAGYLFLENPQEFEKIVSKPFYLKSYELDFFIIQTNLLISTMLLTNQIYELHKKNGCFSLSDCFNLYLNRLIRFLPALVTVTVLTLVGLKLAPPGNVIMNYLEMHRNGCVANWWSTLTMTNFLVNFGDSCYQGSWYLSVDTWLYVTTLILLYVHLKFNLDLKKVLVCFFLTTSAIYGYIIYSNNYDIVFRPTIERSKRLYKCPQFQSLYISPLSSWSTACVGIICGSIYFHTKNKEIKVNIISQAIFFTLFMCFPLVVITLLNMEFSGIERALIGPLLKPTFAKGWGVAILGMSWGYGGIIKKICEWDFAVKMSNFTFSTYIFHFMIIFSRGGFSRTLVPFAAIDLIFNIIQDLTISFSLGILMTVILEMPGLKLQKMYVPQIKKATVSSTEAKFE